jgi:signal peptidase I
MKTDKLKSYILELVLIPILLLAFLIPTSYARWGIAIILTTYAIICHYQLKRKKIKSHYKDQVKVIMIVLGLMYLGVYYATGLYFELVKSKILFSINTLLRIIIPLTIIIVSTENIRESFLCQDLAITIKSKKINLSTFITFISMVLIDLLIYNRSYNINDLDDLLTIVGYVLFASISSNLLFNYVSTRYDKKGIIIYRLIVTLFPYIIPVVPQVYRFFESFIKMLYPYIMYVIIEKLFSKNEFAVSYGAQRKVFVINTILMIITASLIMLISCQFRYGIMVIGSNSMTGTINKGDAIIFEKYNNQELQEGNVIIFEYNGLQTIHRIEKILKVNGEYHYYTKGDANKRADDEYRKQSDIKGVVNLRVKYLGYPTLWMRSLFN